MLPPKPADVAHFDTGRTNRLILPNGICPNWFKSELEVLFLPLYWKDELLVSDIRKLEAILICGIETTFSEEEWITVPNLNQNQKELPETNRESLLVFKSKLTYSKQQWRLNCPPMIKGLCDHQKRVFVTEHSMGISIWSPYAFNEHFG